MHRFFRRSDNSGDRERPARAGIEKRSYMPIHLYASDIASRTFCSNGVDARRGPYGTSTKKRPPDYSPAASLREKPFIDISRLEKDFYQTTLQIEAQKEPGRDGQSPRAKTVSVVKTFGAREGSSFFYE
jgi:hypothetical protein